MGACASKPKVLGDKLRDKPRHAPSRSASKSNGGIPPSPSMKRVTSMNEDKHISSASAIFNQKSMHSSTRVEDSKKYGDVREAITPRKRDDDDGKNYGDKDEDEEEDGNDEGCEEDEDGEEDEDDENEEDDENGDEFEDEQVTTVSQKDGHDDDEVGDEDKSEANKCNKKETILNRNMNEFVGEDEVEEEDKGEHEVVITQRYDEIKEEDVGEKQVVLTQSKNKYEDVGLKSSVCDRKNQMDDISQGKLHDSPSSSKERDNDHINHDQSVDINLHSRDVVNPIEEDQNIFMEKGDVNKLESHGTTLEKQQGNEEAKIKSTSSIEEAEDKPINPTKSPPSTYDNKSVVIEAANPTGLHTLFSSSPANPTKDVVVLDQHPTLHPTLVLKDPPPSPIKKDVVAKEVEVRPEENNSTNRCTNTNISSTFAF